MGDALQGMSSKIPDSTANKWTRGPIKDDKVGRFVEGECRLLHEFPSSLFKRTWLGGARLIRASALGQELQGTGIRSFRNAAASSASLPRCPVMKAAETSQHAVETVPGKTIRVEDSPFVTGRSWETSRGYSDLLLHMGQSLSGSGSYGTNVEFAKGQPSRSVAGKS